MPIILKMAAAAAVGFTVANCSTPQKVASAGGSRTLDQKYGVYASPRVVGENDPVPKGGGRQMVGKPYMIAGRTYVPRENPNGYVRDGLASWYGTAFHGRLTANGEIFDRSSIAAAHPTLPLPSYARVTNLQNKRSIIVRVNDRGPYHANRLLDVSERVAEALDFKRMGTSRVRLEYVGRASVNGSDDNKLMATLRTDGGPAAIPGQSSIMVADASNAPSLSAWSPPREAYASRLASAAAQERAEPPSLAAAQPRAIVRTALAATLTEEDEETPAERAATDAPLPPERPYNLGPSLKGTTPVPATTAATSPAQVLPPQRPSHAEGSTGSELTLNDLLKDQKPIRLARASR